MRYFLSPKSPVRACSDLDQLALPKPKLLKSCIRCRKHKIKCDASKKSPNPCSSCKRKGIQCKIDYVLPPQRSDNLKGLINQVDFIKNEISLLNSHYLKLSGELNLNLPSFDAWKAQQNIGSSSDNGNTSCSEDSGNDLESKASTHKTEENLNLIKLSDGSFISMTLQVNKDKLIIEQECISISKFQKKLNLLAKRLNALNNVFGYNHSHPENEWFDLSFKILDMFKSDKLQLLVLVNHFYPDLKVDFTRFLIDYLTSYYNIVNQLNSALHTSTYSSNLNILLMNKSSKLMKSNNGSIDTKQLIILNKAQLCSLINVENFNSEAFIKKLLQLLFLNLCLNGFKELNHVNELIFFIKHNINNNRKKLNFDKNPDLRFIDNFTNLLNLLGTDDGYKSVDDSNGEKSSVMLNAYNMIGQVVEFSKFQTSSLPKSPARTNDAGISVTSRPSLPSPTSTNVKDEFQMNVPTLFKSHSISSLDERRRTAVDRPRNASLSLKNHTEQSSHNFKVGSLQMNFSRFFEKLEPYVARELQQENNDDLNLIFVDIFLIELSLLILQILIKLNASFADLEDQKMQDNDTQQQQQQDSNISSIFFGLLNSLQSRTTETSSLTGLRNFIINSQPTSYTFTSLKLQQIFQNLKNFKNMPSPLSLSSIKKEEIDGTNYLYGPHHREQRGDMSNDEGAQSAVEMSSSISTSSISSISPISTTRVTKIIETDDEDREMLDLINVDDDLAHHHGVVFDNGPEYGTNDEIQNILETVDWKKESTDDVWKKIGVTI